MGGVLLFSSIISYGLIPAISIGGLIGLQGEVGPQGPQGIQGLIGPQGEVGPEGPLMINGLEYLELPSEKDIGTSPENLCRIIINAATSGYVVL